jgi:NADH dehydrogenase
MTAPRRLTGLPATAPVELTDGGLLITPLVITDPDVLAAARRAQSSGQDLAAWLPVALPMGGHPAETVLHLIRGEEPAPLSVGLVLQRLSLGRSRG